MNSTIGSFIIGESALGFIQTISYAGTSQPVVYDPPTWATRLINTQPAQWFSDSAKAPGGKLYGLLYAIGSTFSQAQQGLLFAYDAAYISTAVSTYLDMAVTDFYGGTLSRRPGESDAVYSARVIAGILSPAATEAALYNAIFVFTGVKPTIVQPWDMSMTGAYGYGFFDAPMGSLGGLRYSTSTPYECLVIIPFFGGYTTPYMDMPAFLSGAGALFDIIARIIPTGVSVWVQMAS